MNKHGFVYLWYDRKHKRYYVGCHWGTEDDGYICSSPWMRQAHRHRPEDFKRRILKRIYTDRKDLMLEEQRYLDMIKPSEIGKGKVSRYYNLRTKVNGGWYAKERKHKTETRRKMSESQKRIGNRPPSNKGKPMSEGQKKKISEANRGRKFTMEQRQRMSEAHKGQAAAWTRDPEKKVQIGAKISATKKSLS